MIYIKYCRKCTEAFDIATNYDICPKCRYKPLDRVENRLNLSRNKHLTKENTKTI